MTRRMASFFLTGFLATGGLGAFAMEADETGAGQLAGVWQGWADPGHHQVVFNIKYNPDQTFIGTLDIPEQGLSGIPLESVTWEKGRVHMACALKNASYNGRINDEGSGIMGKWGKGDWLTLNLTKSPGPPVERPPNEKVRAMESKMKADAELEPRKPYPYGEEDVSFAGAGEGVTLAGTLTLPEGKGPFPAVILLAGSGPVDRDETVAWHRVFLVLSDYLTRQGIATLRYDKRGVGGSSGDYAKATTRDFADDARSALSYLRGRKEVDPGKIGLLGHSEGGLIAPMVAVDSPGVSYLVLLAAPALDGEEILIRQNLYYLQAAKAGEEILEIDRSVQKEIFRVLRSGQGREAALGKIRAIEEDTRRRIGKLDPGIAEKISAQMKDQENFLLSPWMRYFIDYAPRGALEKVRCPVLALDGDGDFQVASKENLPVLEEALGKAGNRDCTIREWKNANHLFQVHGAGGPGDYSDATPTPARPVLEYITDWIKRHAH